MPASFLAGRNDTSARFFFEISVGIDDTIKFNVDSVDPTGMHS
jgi:hypothetical protein